MIAISLLATYLTAPPLIDATEAFRLQIACATAALSLYFWLMKRYSTLTLDWIHDGLRIVFVLVVVAGGIISLGHLRLPPLISLSAAPLVALAYMILASHGYRALSSRNENASLAPHWLALATLFWLFGGFFWRAHYSARDQRGDPRHRSRGGTALALGVGPSGGRSCFCQRRGLVPARG